MAKMASVSNNMPALRPSIIRGRAAMVRPRDDQHSRAGTDHPPRVATAHRAVLALPVASHPIAQSRPARRDSRKG